MSSPRNKAAILITRERLRAPIPYDHQEAERNFQETEKKGQPTGVRFTNGRLELMYEKEAA
jgi:hypothetical protein